MFLFHLTVCSRELNEDVNKLRGTTSKNVEGWTLNVEFGSVRDDQFRKCRNDNSWYGYGHLTSESNGSIKTTLNGYGKARLDFGNCYYGGVRALLNENEIGKATPNELSKKIEFDFNDGDTLELKKNPYTHGIIRFNNFTVLNCFFKL